jgi:hypothetical protein
MSHLEKLYQVTGNRQKMFYIYFVFFYQNPLNIKSEEEGKPFFLLIIFVPLTCSIPSVFLFTSIRKSSWINKYPHMANKYMIITANTAVNITDLALRTTH